MGSQILGVSLQQVGGFFLQLCSASQVRSESTGDFSLTNGVSTGSYKVEGQDVEYSKIVIFVLDDRI